MISKKILNKLKLIYNNKKVLKNNISKKLRQVLTTKNVLAKKRVCTTTFNSFQASIYDIVFALINLVIFSLFIPNQLDKGLITRISSATLIVGGFITNKILIAIAESLTTSFSFGLIEAGCWDLIPLLELNFYSYLFPYIGIAILYNRELLNVIQDII